MLMPLSSFSCSWSLLFTFLSPDLFSICSLVALFLYGPALLLFTCLFTWSGHTRRQISRHPLDVQLIRPGWPVRSCMIFEEGSLVSFHLPSFPLNLFTVSQETQSSLNWFQWSSTLSDKKCFRKSRLHWCLTSLVEWSLVDDKKYFFQRVTRNSDFPIDVLNISSKSALFLLSSNVQRPSFFNLSLYGNSFIPGTVLVNQYCTFFSMCLSLT